MSNLFLLMTMFWGADAPEPADAIKPANAAKVVRAKKAARGLNVEALMAPVAEALVEQIVINGNEPAVAGEDPNVLQWIQSYRGMLVIELEFIRNTCALTKEQRPKVKQAGEAALKLAAQKMARRNNRGFVIAEEANANQGPRQIIRTELLKALKETLTETQMKQFQEESAKRLERRKRAAIMTVVAILDSAMHLSPDQREKLEVSLAKNWENSWETWLMLPNYGGQYVPSIPDQHVIGIFNEDQKKVWQGLQKIGMGDWENVNFQIDDGWWGEAAGS